MARIQTSNDEKSQGKMLAKQVGDILCRLANFNVPTGLAPNIEQHALEAIHGKWPVISDSCRD